MVWRALFRGFVQVHILHHAAVQPVYGGWLMGELARHGYALSPGTLYPILHRMAQDGLIHSEHRVVAGKRRRYYVITPAGEQVLHEARQRAIELVREIAPEEMRRRGHEPYPQELEHTT